MVKDLTKGSPVKMILRFCLPLMIGQFFQQFYNMVDSIIVGRFAGTAELSAVGSTGALSFMVIGFASGICTGLSIPVSRYFGAKDYKQMRRCFANGIYLTVFFCAALTAVSLAVTLPVLRLMNTPDDIIDMAYTYISIIFTGLTATLFYNLSASIMRAVGDSKTPLYLLIFSSVLNVSLDLLFVIRFGMAVRGVAIATVIAQSASAVLGMVIIYKKFSVLRIQSDERQFSFKLCLKLLYIGIPMALQFSITALGSIMLQSAVNGLGSDVIAAVTVAGKIQLMLVLPAETIGITMATYCGQNLGAERIDRINSGVHKSMLLAGAYCIIAVLTAMFGGKYLARLFVDSSQTAIIDLVSQFLKTCAWFYPVLMVLFIYRNSIQGLGYSVPAMCAGGFELAARAYMGYIVIPRYGYSAVCIANPAAWAAADLLLIPVYYIVYFKLKNRYMNSVIFSDNAEDAVALPEKTSE